MTRRLGFVLIAIAGTCMVLVDASDAEARRRLFGGGSWGGNGSHGGWNGSWGGNGSHGSWGGRWRGRARGNCGSHGGNGSYGGNGSHGGYHQNGGSHGGVYHGGVETGGSVYYGEGGTIQSAERQSDVRYYGRRNGGVSVPAPDPIYMEGERRSGERRDVYRQQEQSADGLRSEIRSDEMQRDTATQGSDRGVNPPAPPSPDQPNQDPAGTDQQGPQNRGGAQQPGEAGGTGAESGAST